MAKYINLEIVYVIDAFRKQVSFTFGYSASKYFDLEGFSPACSLLQNKNKQVTNFSKVVAESVPEMGGEVRIEKPPNPNQEGVRRKQIRIKPPMKITLRKNNFFPFS